jgi:phosphohistidine phosphatase
MRTLLVLRHAKAAQDDSALTDHARPLTKKGRKTARLMGELLREEGLLPDLVLSSTAERARATADAVVEAAGHAGEVTYLDELYLAEPPAYLEALRRLGEGAECVLVVGHNPGIEALIFRLTGQMEHMPTAALARCSLPIARWSELGPETLGELGKVYRPKELD